MTSNQQNETKSKRKKAGLFFALLLLLFFLTGPLNTQPAASEQGEGVRSKFLVHGDEILVSPAAVQPTETGHASPLSPATITVSPATDSSSPAGENSPPAAVQTSNLPANTNQSVAREALLDSSSFDDFAPAPRTEADVAEKETPRIEADEDGPEVDDPANPIESEQPDEPVDPELPGEQPEEEAVATPVNSTVYNFGNSEHFGLVQNISQADFDDTFIVKHNTWEVAEDGSGLSALHNNEGRVFVGHDYLNYFVKAVAALGPSALNNDGQPLNRGGLGIMFETTLDENHNDRGHILQFDRGYGRGEIIIRNREIKTNSNGTAVTHEGPVLFRYSDRTVLPDKNEDPDWWAAEHQLELKVSSIEKSEHDPHNNDKVLSVHLNQLHLFDWEFASTLTDEEDRYTGLRLWQEVSEAAIVGMEVGELSQEKNESPDSGVEEGSSDPAISADVGEALKVAIAHGDETEKPGENGEDKEQNKVEKTKTDSPGVVAKNGGAEEAGEQKDEEQKNEMGSNFVTEQMTNSGAKGSADSLEDRGTVKSGPAESTSREGKESTSVESNPGRGNSFESSAEAGSSSESSAATGESSGGLDSSSDSGGNGDSSGEQTGESSDQE